jgi:hypothetical protein
MENSAFSWWIGEAPLYSVALGLLGAMLLAFLLGYAVRRLERRFAVRRETKLETTHEGYLVSAVLGLLALLLAFTLALGLDRYETRRTLVITEANAIGTAYLRAQLVPEPHRSRLGRLLMDYTDNRIALATTADPAERTRRVAVNDRLLDQLWAAVVPAVDTIQQRGFANVFLQPFNDIIDLDTARKVARTTGVPKEVLAALSLYVVVAAGTLGYVLSSARGRIGGLILFSLVALSLMLIIDINRPTAGWLKESQAPMLMLQKTFRTRPAGVFDQYRGGG